MIKAIIFDFGGPIVEWESPMKKVFGKHEDHHNLERDTLHTLFSDYFHASDVGAFHSITEFIEKTKPSISMTVEELNEVFDEANASMYVRPEIIDFILELKKEYKVALLSNFTSGLEMFLQDVFNIYHLFDVVVSSYNVKMKKPDPRIYEHTLEQLGVKADEAVFTDDLEVNIEGAAKLGIHSIRFENSEQCMNDMRALLSK